MERTRMRVISGGRHRAHRFGSVTVVAGTHRDPPFQPEVEVLEEDTWRLLSAPAHASPAAEHPVRLMTALIDDRPARPGSVLASGRRWLAVVYDLDQDPVCREEWVSQALDELLRTAARRRCRSLSLPLLGHTHGGLHWKRSLALLDGALRQAATAAPSPMRIWLRLPDEHR
jgi:hypothetical protein